MAKTAAALHILVKEEKLALDLLEQIKNGADFGKLAKKHSICPSGKRGGDLGEFRQGQMVPAFDKVVFSCPVLEPTGPLHTQFGYHIIKVLYLSLIHISMNYGITAGKCALVLPAPCRRYRKS